MKLLSLEVQNFGPYKGTQKIRFPEDPKENVMIISGVNTRGKTSLLNSLRWVLYGKALGRHSREIKLHQLLNSEAAREGDFTLSVSLEFEASGCHYNLQRKAKMRPLVASPERPEDFEVMVALRKDSSVIPSVFIPHELNRIAPEQVSRFFLFDGELLEEYENLLFEGSRDGDRIRDAIEQVLGVPALLQGRDDIRTLLALFKKSQDIDLKQIESIRNLTEKQSKVQTELDMLTSDLISQQGRLLETQEERDNLADEIDKLQSVYAKALDLDSKKEQVKDIKNQFDQVVEDRLDDMRDLWKICLRPVVEPRIGVLREEREASLKRISGIAEKRKKLRELQMLITDRRCPTCGHQTTSSDGEAVQSQISQLEHELSKIEGINLSSEISQFSEEFEKLGLILHVDGQERLLRDWNKSEQMIVRRLGLEASIEEIQAEIDGYDTKELARKRSRKVNLDKEEERLQIEIGGVRDRIAQVEKELKITSKAISTNPVSKKSENTAYVDLFQDLDTLFNESIGSLRDNLRKHVEERATEAFRKLISQDKYDRLSINSRYGLSIIDVNGNSIPVRSAGAEQIVALSLIHGLSHTGKSANFIMMDTPFGRLDQFHRNSILKFLPNTTGQLILLVHDGEIRSGEDLASISDRIGAYYEIESVTHTHSEIRVPSLKSKEI